MSFMQNLKTDDNIQNETDSVGGGPLESAIYNHTINMAYLEKTVNGAMRMQLHLEDDTGREARFNLIVTSGDSKGNKNYYENANGEKKYLPGFNNANSLSLLTVGKELGDLEPEEKVVKVYSFDAGAEVPTKVQALTELMGKQIKTGVQKQLVDKRAKGDDGQYYPTGETREVNEIDKFFRATDGFTTTEIRAGAEEATFMETWRSRFEGQLVDRTDKDVKRGSTGNAGAPGGNAANNGGGAKPTQSLFAAG